MPKQDGPVAAQATHPSWTSPWCHGSLAAFSLRFGFGRPAAL